MDLNKTQGDFLQKVIEHWESEQTITKEKADELKASYTVDSFEWKELAKYSFWIAIVCGVIAIGSVIADRFLMNWLEKFFLSSYSLASATFGILAAFSYYWGWRRRKKMPYKIFSNETILFIGVLFTAISVGYLGMVLDNGSGHYSLLFLLAAGVYALLGLYFSSVMVWVFALLSLGGWFGTETGYLTDWGNYFLGMNYPLRFVVFGAVLLIGRFLLKGKRWFSNMDNSTYIAGMLYLFIFLWLLSIFGNSPSLSHWFATKQIELWQWNFVTIVASAIAVYIGLKRDDLIARGFGITFFLLTLYSLYFSLLWDVMHVALFFSLLAVSFWLLGRKAEKIWHLEFLERGSKDMEENMN